MDYKFTPDADNDVDMAEPDHPIGATVGAAGAATVGAIAGLAAGPIGAAVGAAAGAFVGSIIGTEIAEAAHPITDVNKRKTS